MSAAHRCGRDGDEDSENRSQDGSNCHALQTKEPLDVRNQKGTLSCRPTVDLKYFSKRGRIDGAVAY